MSKVREWIAEDWGYDNWIITSTNENGTLVYPDEQEMTLVEKSAYDDLEARLQYSKEWFDELKRQADNLVEILELWQAQILSHYSDCCYYNDDNEDECDSYCDCGMWDIHQKSKKILVKYRGEE